MKIFLKKDSRDLSYGKHYGQTTVFPAEFNVDTPAIDTVQPSGNVMCTCITSAEIAQDQTGTQYSYVDLFNRVPSNNEGAEPRVVLKEVVKNGLLPVGGDVRETKWKSFYRADEGGMDYFDNLRSALYLAHSPIAICTPWYWEWMNETVMSEGKNQSNYHMFCVEGWTVINGEPHLIIEAWVGRKQYMPRAVCNKVMSTWGSQAWVLATDEITEKRDKTILQKIFDLLTNFIISFKKQMPMPQEENTPIAPESTNQEKLYAIAKSLLKKHLTLDESVPKNVGCAQALSYVLKECGYPMYPKGISGTASLYYWLQDQKNHFEEVEAGKPGDIIINVTGTGVSTRRGHVGVVGKYQIMSNNSITGKWDTSWVLRDWLRFYEEQGKMKTHYFRAK